MKFPNHIILDINKNMFTFSTQYWMILFLNNFNMKNELSVNNLFNKNKFFNQIKFNVLYENNFKKNISILPKYINLIFKTTKENLTNKNTKLWSLFDVNFLKKEKIYTKLKYSRTPQYDIVSGGVAAIFSGFLGFLICEKFGFELLDSGDFYFLFMYAVFFFFLIRLFFKILDMEGKFWNVLSFKWAYVFYKILINLIYKKLKY